MTVLNIIIYIFLYSPFCRPHIKAIFIDDGDIYLDILEADWSPCEISYNRLISNKAYIHSPHGGCCDRHQPSRKGKSDRNNNEELYINQRN